MIFTWEGYLKIALIRKFNDGSGNCSQSPTPHSHSHSHQHCQFKYLIIPTSLHSFISFSFFLFRLQLQRPHTKTPLPRRLGLPKRRRRSHPPNLRRLCLPLRHPPKPLPVRHRPRRRRRQARPQSLSLSLSRSLLSSIDSENARNRIPKLWLIIRPCLVVVTGEWLALLCCFCSSQSRADLLTLGLAVTNILAGLVWLSVKPKSITVVSLILLAASLFFHSKCVFNRLVFLVQVNPRGVECKSLCATLPEVARNELLW